jgi:Fe-S-cluster-containing dehydrogenase component
VACKQELEIGIGPRPMLVKEIGPRLIGGRLNRDFVPVMCQHCLQPKCMDACPAEAIYRAEDKSIQIDHDLCIQCGACESACPFGAIEFSDTHGPVKCTLCFNRRENKWLPSCAQHCQGRVFSVASEHNRDSIIAGKKFVWSAGQVVYVSNKWASLGKMLT